MLLDNCTVVTMDAERRILRDAAIVVQGNSIAAVGKSGEVRPASPRSAVRDLHGWVVMPGLVDGHIHLPQAMLRGCGDEVPLWVWMAERIFILEGNYTGRGRALSMRLAIARDDQGGHDGVPRDADPRPPRPLVDLAEAVEATGMRAVLPRGDHRRRRLPRRVAAQQGPRTRRRRRRSRTRSRSPSSTATPSAIRIWFGPRSTGGISEESAARARRRSPARRAWACASTTR